MLTAGKGTHYCECCGFDMGATEDRMCVARDGDFCEAKKRGRKRPIADAQGVPNWRVAMWKAIDAYAVSVGGDPTKRVLGNTSRQKAVAAVEAAVREAIVGARPRT
jgi:hypothetical protein